MTGTEADATPVEPLVQLPHSPMAKTSDARSTYSLKYLERGIAS